jgi:hypothetical protein
VPASSGDGPAPATGGRRRRAMRVALALALGIGMLARPGIGSLPGGWGQPLGIDTVRAACASTPSLVDAIAQADVVFVGTVIFLENDSHWATVDVEERWRGAADLGSTVIVHGSGEPGLQTAIDRAYELRRYLFVVGRGDGFLVDNACTGTTPWTDALARLRPGDVQPAPGLAVASPIPDVNMDLFLPVAALAGALAVAVISYLIILRSRGRPPDWMR